MPTKSGHSSHISEHNLRGASDARIGVGAIRFEGGRRPVVVELLGFLSQGVVLVLVGILKFGGSGPQLW